MTQDESRSRTVRELSQRLRGIEHNRKLTRGSVSTGIAALDGLLPDGGFRGGTLTEWITEGAGSGAATLILTSVAQIMRMGGAFVVIDEKCEFYAPAAALLNIDLNHTILIRPTTPIDALWALEQSLQCPGVAVSLCWIGHLGDRMFRRLQLAVEKGGGIGFFIRPTNLRHQPSWAEVRLLVQPLASLDPSSGRRIQLELLRCHGGNGGETIELELFT